MLLRIFLYMKGYFLVKITGHSPERFFNLCSNRGIELRSIVPIEEEGYTFFLDRADYEEIVPLLEKTGTQVEILQQYGLPYFLKRYRKRKIFALGFLLCVGIVYGFSLFVWDIQVSGNVQYSKEEVISYVEQKYLAFGTLKSKVDCAKIEEELREYYDQIAWISCELKGTQLHIQIKETLQQNEDVEDKVPCDIIARKAGIITSIITRNGTPLVKINDTVQKGDVLISGVIHIYDDTNTLLESEVIAAQGDVLAETVYYYEDTFAMSYYEKQYTGKEDVYYGIEWMGKQYIPYVPKNKFHASDQYEEKIQVKIGHTYSLPFSFFSYKRKEFEPVRKSYTKEEAKEKETKRLEKFLDELEEKGVEIVQNNVKISIDDETCKGEGTIRVIEPIGKIRPITKNSSKGEIQ